MRVRNAELGLKKKTKATKKKKKKKKKSYVRTDIFNVYSAFQAHKVKKPNTRPAQQRTYVCMTLTMTRISEKRRRMCCEFGGLGGRGGRMGGRGVGWGVGG